MIIHLKETLEAIDEGDNHIKETIKGLTSYIESQGITKLLMMVHQRRK